MIYLPTYTKATSILSTAASSLIFIWFKLAALRPIIYIAKRRFFRATNLHSHLLILQVGIVINSILDRSRFAAHHSITYLQKDQHNLLRAYWVHPIVHQHPSSPSREHSSRIHCYSCWVRLGMTDEVLLVLVPGLQLRLYALAWMRVVWNHHFGMPPSLLEVRDSEESNY